MKIPRNLTGIQLVKLLDVLGYRVTRQTGSHIRITTTQNGTHNVTVPAHNPLKTGTLSAILGDVAAHFGISKDELLIRLM